jgi:hypothetical protein
LACSWLARTRISDGVDPSARQKMVDGNVRCLSGIGGDRGAGRGATLCRASRFPQRILERTSDFKFFPVYRGVVVFFSLMGPGLRGRMERRPLIWRLETSRRFSPRSVATPLCPYGIAYRRAYPCRTESKPLPPDSTCSYNQFKNRKYSPQKAVSCSGVVPLPNEKAAPPPTDLKLSGTRVHPVCTLLRTGIATLIDRTARPRETQAL